VIAKREVGLARPQPDAGHPSVERGSPSARPWPDWLGFAGFSIFAVWLLTGPRSLGVFLLVPVLYELGTAATFLMRGRAERSVRDVLPRLAAYASTFLIPVFVRVSLHWYPALIASSPSLLQQLAGASLWLMGSVLAFWPLWYLRGSFSIEPAARRLVTSGPYQIARHPIYSSYLLIFSGLLVLHPTAPMLVVTCLWLAVTLMRIRFEERVLSEAFPAYTAYRRRVGAFGPRFWRSDDARAPQERAHPA
jgi:protein-S-isoprenylcysteine O-methyltransferase Ste14